MVEYKTKVAVAEQAPPAPAADGPKIYPSRGIFKYRDTQGKLWKFKTEKEAKAHLSGDADVVDED
jgi:hypothetical protein